MTYGFRITGASPTPKPVVPPSVPAVANCVFCGRVLRGRARFVGLCTRCRRFVSGFDAEGNAVYRQPSPSVRGAKGGAPCR